MDFHHYITIMVAIGLVNAGFLIYSLYLELTENGTH